MSRHTQCAAMRAFRRLADVNAGRLRGQCLRYHDSAPIPPGTLNPEAAARLRASVYRRSGTPVTADMIFYVVSCDATPIAWLTYDAQVLTPPATLTGYQLRHQARTVDALSNLSRPALRQLADLRDTRDQRTTTGPATTCGRYGRLRVANPADPTLTFPSRITGDIEQSRTHLRALTGTTGDVLIVDAYGYGGYGRHCDRLDPSVLCTIEHLATVHNLPTTVIGDWLHTEGASHATALTRQQLTDAFTAAYAGLHATRRAFATAERDRLDWTTALREAGIPDRLFDTNGFTTDLFDREVHGFDTPDDSVAVFRRG